MVFNGDDCMAIIRMNEWIQSNTLMYGSQTNNKPAKNKEYHFFAASVILLKVRESLSENKSKHYQVNIDLKGHHIVDIKYRYRSDIDIESIL